MSQKGFVKAALIIGVIVLSVGAIFYINQIGPKTPEAALAKMIDNMEEVSSFSVNADTSLKMEDTDISLLVSGSFLGEDMLSSTEMSADVDMEGMMFSVNLEAITLQDKGYIKIKSIPLFFYSFLSMAGIENGSLDGIWIEFDLDEVAQVEEDSNINQQALQLLRERETYKIVRVGQEGALSQYKVIFDKDILIEAVDDVIALLSEEDSIQREVTKEEIEEFIELFDKIEFDLWISRRDNLLHRIAFNFTLSAEEEEAQVSFDANLSDFNKQFKIIPPENYQKIEDIISAPSVFEDMVI